MASLINRDFTLLSALRVPLVQAVRCRSKINVGKPRAPHYQRQLVNSVTQPYYPKKSETRFCFMTYNEQRGIPDADDYHPYKMMLAREIRERFEKARMIGVFQLNSIKANELFPVRVECHKRNIALKYYSLQLLKPALENTRYASLLPLFKSKTCITFSEEQNVSSLLRATRKCHQMILLCGIIDNQRILNRNEFMAYAKLPSLQDVQAEFAQTLNMAASNVVQQLEAHQNAFVNVLDIYSKDEYENKTDATTATTAPKEAPQS